MVTDWSLENDIDGQQGTRMDEHEALGECTHVFARWCNQHGEHVFARYLVETGDGDGTTYNDFVIAPTAELAGMFALQLHGLIFADKATCQARRDSIEMPEGTGYGEDGTMGERFTEADWAARGLADTTRDYSNGESGGAPTRPMTPEIAQRLLDLGDAIKAENISQGEIAELQSYAAYIPTGDVELLEWAGVAEFEEEASE